MSLPSLRLPACLVLSAAAFARADIAWLDFQDALAAAPATFHQAFPVADGARLATAGLAFTLVGPGVGTRSRGHDDEMLKDFAFRDGAGAALTLRIAGLPAGDYTVESWHFDLDFPGAVEIAFSRQGEPARTLVPNHVFAASPASYTITSDGGSTYELRFRENDGHDRVRLNGLRLRAAGSPPGLPGVFVDIDAANTAAVGGSPAPFFTDDASAPGFVGGPLWRRRAGFGFDTAGNRDIFEKDANFGLGDAAALVTTVTGLPPGSTHAVHVAFLSVPSESWRVQAGLAPDALELFTPAGPAGSIIDLGRSGERNSNRNQYLGFVGNAVADANGALRLYSNDGDADVLDGTARTWIEGFYLGAATPVAPLPGDAVQIAPDGAWTWFNDERAIVHDGSLYAGYVKAGGQYGVTRHDFADGRSLHAVISTTTSQQRDDHNNPSLTVLPDGRLLALYAKHIGGNQFYQRTSLVPRPASEADWGPEIICPLPANNTYNNTYRLPAEDDRVFNFHRSINFNPTLTISDDLGSTWGEPRQFIGAGTGRTRPYTRFSSNNHDRIDAIYTDGHPRDVANSLYHLYYQGGAFRRTDGTVVKSLDALPVNHDGGERGSVIYPYSDAAWGPNDGPDDWIPAGRAWTWDVHQDADGHPVAVFQVQRDEVAGRGWENDRIYYYYARWTGTEWQRRFIAHAGRPLYSAEDDYAGGMCLDPEDPRVVYISSNAADPFALGDTTHVPLRANNRYELWRGVTADGGLTFTWTQLTVDSAADNLRPIVPPDHGRTECLVWFHGTYNTYTNYSTRVLGRLGEPRTPVAPPAPEAPEATTSAPTEPASSAPKPLPPMRNPVRR